ncbi:MAG TPA: TIGR02996 domain-containing protein, partial [Gemmataceae bacterium]|nr:TIGR02996 domain-containing protein [Gemmataceae bacterium]
MSQADAFFDAIRESPDDDAPRLIFADWLDDHGDPDRAAFIRAQVRRPRLAPGDLAGPDLEDEADDLLGRHPEWAGRLPELAREWEFRRGFVESVAIAGGTFLSYASSLAAAFPLRGLRFLSAAPQVTFLARSPHLAH